MILNVHKSDTAASNTLCQELYIAYKDSQLRRTGKPKLIYAWFLIEAHLTTDLIKSRATQGRIHTKTNGGLQVDHPVIEGSGGMPPRNFFKNEAFLRYLGGVTDTQIPPPLDTALQLTRYKTSN